MSTSTLDQPDHLLDEMSWATLEDDYDQEPGFGSALSHPASTPSFGFSLDPVDADDAALRRRFVFATLVAITVLSLLTIPALGAVAVIATLLFGALAVAFGYAWWRRNQVPSPFGGIVTGAPLPSAMTASSFGEAEPVRR